MRDLGLLFEEAGVAMTAAIVLGPDEPDGRAAAIRAREILDELRAAALAGRFEAVLAEPLDEPPPRRVGGAAVPVAGSTRHEAVEGVG